MSQIGATSSLVLINLEEGDYDEALIEAVGVAFGLGELRASKNLFHDAFNRRVASIRGTSITRQVIIDTNELSTSLAYYGRLGDWLAGGQVPVEELPFGLAVDLPVEQRALEFLRAGDGLLDNIVSEANELGIPVLEAEQAVVAARSAVRNRLEDADPAAFARLDEAEEIFASVCRANSFSADTHVVLADGTTTHIADVAVGDHVLAWDLDTGTAVSREVAATLPHTDWLLEAHFSDGSVLEVTEDHRFWSVTDTDWVELQHLDTTDILLTPDGATVTVDWLDWDAGAVAPAWDLTVDDVHNFFVAADPNAEPVLVHNATRRQLCELPLGTSRLRAIDGLAADLRESLESVVGDLTASGLSDEEIVRFVDFAISNPARVRPQLEAWPVYVPLLPVGSLPNGALQGGVSVVDGVVVADIDLLLSAAKPPVGSRADGASGLATDFNDGLPEVNLINSPNVDETGYWRTSPSGQIRVHPDGRLFGFDRGFPDFPARFEMTLDQTELLRDIATTQPFRNAETRHFREANSALANALEANPELRNTLGITESVEELRSPTLRAPDGFTWHHHQDFGRMQLVPTSVHGPVNHTGGIALWPRLATYLGLT